jgi:hypothetical protein
MALEDHKTVRLKEHNRNVKKEGTSHPAGAYYTRMYHKGPSQFLPEFLVS